MSPTTNTTLPTLFDLPEEPGQNGRYARDEVVSIWIKAMRLGDIQAALYWTQVMVNELRIDMRYLFRRLAIFAFEDAYDPGFAQHVAAGMACAEASRSRFSPHGDSNIPYGLVEAACRAKKFWECPEGRERERLWAAAEALYASRVEVDMPTYAIDMHTKAGRAMKDDADCRFSGDQHGRVNMCVRYEIFGSLRPDIPGMLTWEDLERIDELRRAHGGPR